MQGQVYTVAQAAAAVGCNPRTIRRHLATGALPGAHQQRTAHGPTWRIPAEAIDRLRAHLALDVAPGAVEVVAQVEAAQAPPQQAQQLAPLPVDQAAGIGHALAVAVDALRVQLDQTREDSLWWRCEALDARQQLDQAQAAAAALRQQLDAAQVEAAQLRAQVERHQRPTVPIAQLRAVQ